jgi:hypothetical protein
VRLGLRVRVDQDARKGMTSGPRVSAAAGGGARTRATARTEAELGSGLSGRRRTGSGRQRSRWQNCGNGPIGRRSRPGQAKASCCGKGVGGAAVDFGWFGLKTKTGRNRIE